MKKLVMLIAMLTIAGIASAGIVDGDFSGTGFHATGQANVETNHLDQGWVLDADSRWTYDTANNQADMPTGYRLSDGTSFGQIWTDNSAITGTQELTVNYDGVWSGAGGNRRLRIAVFGMNTLASVSLATGSDGNAAPAGSTVLYDDDFNFANGANITETLSSVDFGTGYTYIAYRIRGITVSEDSLISVNNVVVPEPATVGMLGLGALVSLLIRRIRA